MQTPPPRDTVNKQVVRILLECILVFIVGAEMDVIFTDFPDAKTWNNPHIASNE